MKLPVVIRNEEVKVRGQEQNACWSLGISVGPCLCLLVRACACVCVSVCWSMSMSVGPCLCLLVRACVCQSVKTKPLKHLKLCFEMSLKCNGVIMKYKGAAGGGGS